MSAEKPLIEVDPAVYQDSGEDYATSGYATDTTSLTSSINSYIFENGELQNRCPDPGGEVH